MSSERSDHSRDNSLGRKSTSPPAAHGSTKVVGSDSEKHSTTSRDSSRKKKKRKHHHHHHHRQSKSPESLEHKHSRKEKKKHKSKKKHKHHHAHSERRLSEEREEELSHKMEDKQARDPVGGDLESEDGNVIEGKAHVMAGSREDVAEMELGGDIEDKLKSHDTATECSTGTGAEILVVGPKFNTRQDVPAAAANDVLVNNEPTVEQQMLTLSPLVLVGVASCPADDQSATEE